MMKRFGGRAAICFAAMIWTTVAHAGSADVTGWGIGGNSCGKFIASTGSLAPGKYRDFDSENDRFVTENTQYQQWLMGFLTGFNAGISTEGKQQISRKIDLAGIDLWMRNWCNQHPTKNVFQGMNAFIN